MGAAADVRREGCRVVQVDGRPVGVISVGDAFYAVADRCPHMGAAMCTGSLSGTLLPSAPHELVYGLDQQVIRCPWHGWEFDITNGQSVFNPHRTRVRSYDVTVEADTKDDPSIETYPLSVEDGVVMLHV